MYIYVFKTELDATRFKATAEKHWSYEVEQIGNAVKCGTDAYYDVMQCPDAVRAEWISYSVKEA